MSFFNPKIPIKQKEKPQHPWEKRIKTAYTRIYKYGHNSAKNPIYPPKIDKQLKDRIKFTVIGNRVRKEFIYCLYLVKGLHRTRHRQFEAPLIRGVTSVEWPKVLNDLKIEFGGIAYCLKSEVAVLMNNKLIGGDAELKELIESRYDYYISVDYYKEGIQQFSNYIKSSGRPCAYMHIAIDDVPIGTLIFMLYSDIVPNTCENFLRLCQTRKGGYVGTPIHRIVTDCWIQCGGFHLKNNNKLDCENFIVPHDRRGVLCMANDGRHTNCSTQFFVLLQPAPWMQSKYVAFGQLIEGERTLCKIQSIKTWYESPTSKIIIYKAGIFNMECHYVPVNKNTNAYITGHIEDLSKLKEMFRELILDVVFTEIYHRMAALEALEEEEEEEDKKLVAKDVHPTQRFMRKKDEIEKPAPKDQDKQKSISRAGMSASSAVTPTTENYDFDVDVYEYEFEDYYTDIALKTKASMAPNIVVLPQQPYYIPLTDVAYPGEVASTFDLKKLLLGEYSLRKDQESNPAKRKPLQSAADKRISIPEELIETLFDYFGIDDDSVKSLNSDDEHIIHNYLEEYADTVSFAGPVIRKIANMSQKFGIFDEALNVKAKHKKPDLLTDDQIRMMRIARKEMKFGRHKKVGIKLSSSKLSTTKIRRRATGFIRTEQVEEMSGVGSDDSDEDEIEKSVRIATYPEPTRRVGGNARSGYTLDDAPRQSVLSRLLDQVASDSDEESPTLKNYRPTFEEQERSYIILTNSLMDTNNKEKTSRYFRPGSDAQGVPNILNLQHGKEISRKISSDYVRTIDDFENMESSTRQRYRRPSISVNEYRNRNLQLRKPPESEDELGSKTSSQNKLT